MGSHVSFANLPSLALIINCVVCSIRLKPVQISYVIRYANGLNYYIAFPSAHRELHLVWVAVHVIILETIRVIAANYALAFTQYNSTFASVIIIDVLFITLAMAGDQFSGYSSGRT
ncbi:MAG: hypothetical protein EZS28_037077 [Streblomastix strix]|uniref:Uncharacterized protein n=1 Tax=Streblomastix strix TaxID=222440 RepID=A0A5J4UCR9_9EUKA|nr:MAG: hypothetical protein EZS28_037077 [Streblomastix strix]